MSDERRGYDGAAQNVRRLFRDFQAKWRNAEDFLDYVDTAADVRPDEEPNPHASWLSASLSKVGQSTSAPELRAAARRLIAAECITFNYDRVVEKLHAVHNEDARRMGGPLSDLRVLVPGALQDPGEWKGSTPLLKLHGSVDWRRPQPRDVPQCITVRDETFALLCKDEELAIATPGPSKQREGTIGYRDLWEIAKEALQEASAIVFVGYRFPETDADARTELEVHAQLRSVAPAG